MSSLAVQVEASRMGLDMTGLTWAGWRSSGFSGVMKALILFWTELLVRLTVGLVLGLEGTTGSGGADRSTGLRTPWLTMLWLLLPLRWTGVI